MPTDRAPDYDDKRDEGRRPTVTANAPAPVLEPNEARGAATHHNVRFVLAVSVGVLIVAYVILYFAFFRGSAPPAP
jgi:hypothetical protein